MNRDNSFSETLSQCSERIRRTCLSVLRNRDDAEDAAQEVQMKALRAAESYRHTETPCAWFATIAKRHCLDILRQRKRRPVADAVSVDDEWRFTEALAPPPDTTSLRLIAIETCLKRLTAREEEVVRLFLLEDLTWAEVAEALETTVGSARNDYERACRRLKPCLAAAGLDVTD